MNNEDKDLFRQAMVGIKPLTQDSYQHIKPKGNVKAQYREDSNLERHTQDVLSFLSDDYEPMLEQGDQVRYLREGEDSYLLKQLRRGDFSPEIFLDLHGLTKAQAKNELASLIVECLQKNLFCASVMTGYGTYVLKRQVPLWLVQYPKVRALHTAPKIFGGEAAVLVLFDRN